MFLQVFSFHHWFLLLFFGCFYCSLHLFISPTLEFIYHCFHRCFYFITDFYYCFSGGFISLTFYHDCFFVRYFSFVLLYRQCYGFEKAFFSLSCFLPYTPSTHLPQYCRCYSFKRAFFTLKGFFLTLLLDIWHNLLLSRLQWEPAVLSWRLHGLPLRFEKQTRPICLFESHSVQQKVLVSKFYVYVLRPYGILYQPRPGFEPTI